MTGHEPRPPVTAPYPLRRDAVLRATDRLLAGRPWSEVTMAQVAAATGVSRQTVYNEFGNRRDLALAYASWAGDQMLDEVERCVALHRHDLAGALVAAFTVFLDLGAGHPLIRALADGDSGDELAASLAGPRPSPIVERATSRLVDIIATTWPELPADAVVPAAEVLVRLAISHLLLPSGTPEAAASQVATVLAPFVALLDAASRPAPT